MKIQPIPMGLCTSYLIRDHDVMLVDAGQQGYGKIFHEKLRDLGVAPSDLTLIFLTHGHWDHIGFLSELKPEVKCPVAISLREKKWVEEGLKPLPPPITLWGRILEAIIKTYFMPRQTFQGVPVEIALKDEPFSLEMYGISGSVYPTPGHTSGSMSLILSTGEAFVGDLAMNGAPLSLHPAMPLFAEDPGSIPQSWKLILQAGARVIYPAHVRPFKASALEKLLIK